MATSKNPIVSIERKVCLVNGQETSNTILITKGEGIYSCNLLSLTSEEFVELRKQILDFKY